MIIIERKRRVEKANESSLFQMITSTGGGGGSMELIIAKPLFLPSVLKSQHYYHHESSDYPSKEARSNSPENQTNEVKLRIHRNKPIDKRHEQYRIYTSTIPRIMFNTGSLTTNETFPVRIKH
jgi:hypothetical protein